MTIFHYTNPINAYSIYKDNDTQKKEKKIKQHNKHDENKIDRKSEVEHDSICF